MKSIQSEVGILRVRELPFEVNREIESITPEVMKGVVSLSLLFCNT